MQLATFFIGVIHDSILSLLQVGDILNTKQGAAMPDYSQTVFFGEV